MATTVNPILLKIDTAIDPTPPVAPVTKMLPDSGLIHYP
jgi:hypothetical protein